MIKPNLAHFFRSVQVTVSKHSPEILTGIGIAGMITTTVLAVKATPKALKLIEETKKEEHKEGLTPLETVKAAWKPYIPAVVTGVLSTACLIGSTSVSTRRTAAIATAYKISETALQEYKEKVVETLGEKKERLIQEELSGDKVDKNPIGKNEIIVTEKGNTLFLDSISKRYFKSDIQTVKRIQNDLNHNMLYDMFGYVSLNDFYDELGLERSDIGDELGWNTKELIDIHFGSRIADNGEPCIVLDYRVAPKYDYTKF